MKVVYLDAGHGGRDPGAINNRLKEKDIVLDVGVKVGRVLERHNVKVIHSRTDDTFLELFERADKANRARADMFVSVHTNSFGKPQAQGFEVFHFLGSNEGKALATDIHSEIVREKLYTKDRGIKTANFAVLRRTKMKSVLIELAFISNKEDVKILTDKRTELVQAISRGILKNLGISYKEDNKTDTKSNKVKIRKGNKVVEVEGYLKDNTNYVEARDLFEKLGYKVSWDNENRIVVID